ncbi:MAG: CBS domain-containing protein, partial [Algiphilus sp.]
TASTTVTMVLGDALAVALLEARGFTEEDFARSHPGGALGRRLLLKVADLMHTGDDIPMVAADTPLDEALLEVTRKRMGMTVVTDPEGRASGIFTDGDLRRVLESDVDIHAVRVADVMTKGGRRVSRDALAAEAVHAMEEHAITSLLVEDGEGQVCGVVHLHDLLRAGAA